MKTYHCVVKIKTDMIIDADNVKEMFIKVKESWKDMHDISLSDSEICIKKRGGNMKKL
jgi:hypothetical protein